MFTMENHSHLSKFPCSDVTLLVPDGKFRWPKATVLKEAAQHVFVSVYRYVCYSILLLLLWVLMSRMDIKTQDVRHVKTKIVIENCKTWMLLTRIVATAQPSVWCSYLFHIWPVNCADYVLLVPILSITHLQQKQFFPIASLASVWWRAGFGRTHVDMNLSTYSMLTPPRLRTWCCLTT